MANFWLTTFHSHGKPEQTTVLMKATEGKDGSPFNGTISLAMCKGDNLNTAVPVEIEPGQNWVAEFNNGVFEENVMNLSVLADQGYTTLVIDSDGRKILRTFRTWPGAPQKDNRTENRPDNRGANRGSDRMPVGNDDFTNCDVDLAVDVREVKDGDTLKGYTVVCEVTASRKKKTVDKVPIIFIVDGMAVDTGDLETEDGLVRHVFEDVPPGGANKTGKMKITARIKGTSVGKTKFAEVKKPEEKKAPPKWTLAARLARPHPVNGWFTITGETLKDGKPSALEIVAYSDLAVLEVKAVLGSITPDTGRNFKVTTADGLFSFSAKFQEAEADMVLQLTSGVSVSVPMVKPL